MEKIKIPLIAISIVIIPFILYSLNNTSKEVTKSLFEEAQINDTQEKISLRYDRCKQIFLHQSGIIPIEDEEYRNALRNIELINEFRKIFPKYEMNKKDKNKYFNLYKSWPSFYMDDLEFCNRTVEEILPKIIEKIN